MLYMYVEKFNFSNKTKVQIQWLVTSFVSSYLLYKLICGYISWVTKGILSISLQGICYIL